MITPMKRKFIACFTCMAFFAVCPTQLFSQLEIVTNGNTILGPLNTWSEYTLNIVGPGDLGSEGIIGFGNNTSSSSNVLIGEYGPGNWYV